MLAAGHQRDHPGGSLQRAGGGLGHRSPRAARCVRRRAGGPARPPVALLRRRPPGADRPRLRRRGGHALQPRHRPGDGYVLLTAEYNHGYPGRAEERTRLHLRRVAPQAGRIRRVGEHRRGAGHRAAAGRRGRVRDGAAPLTPSTCCRTCSSPCARRPTPHDLSLFAPLEPRLDLLADDLAWWTRALAIGAGRRAGRPPPWTIRSARCAPPSVASTSSPPVWTTPSWSRSPTTRVVHRAGAVASRVGCGHHAPAGWRTSGRDGRPPTTSRRRCGTSGTPRRRGPRPTTHWPPTRPCSRRSRPWTRTSGRGSTFPMGPLSLGFNEFAGLRLNEHVFHSWDIAVVLDDGAGCPPTRPPWWSTTSPSSRASAGGPTARSGPSPCAPRDPERARRAAPLGRRRGAHHRRRRAGARSRRSRPRPSSRLVYGRLDPATRRPSPVTRALLDALRAVFPGP